MKMKNKTNRNINILAPHTGNGGIPFRVSVIAGSTLEIDEETYEKVRVAAEKLVDVGVLEYVESPVSKLTKAEIITKVLEEVDVELSDKLKHNELQEKAEQLGVEV